MFEKRLASVPAQLFTANGTATGLITVADASLFKVKQEVILSSLSLPNLNNIEVKAVVSATQLYVGPKGSSISARTDVSMYTTLIGSVIMANEQFRPSIPFEEYMRAIYEEEPTVAMRTFLVDKLGNNYTTLNPFPVVEASAAAAFPTIANVVVPVANIEQSYAVPAASKKILIRVRDGLAKMKFSFTAGQSGTQFITITAGSEHVVDNVVTNAGLTLYFQVSKPNQVVEILSWA